MENAAADERPDQRDAHPVGAIRQHRDGQCAGQRRRPAMATINRMPALVR